MMLRKWNLVAIRETGAPATRWISSINWIVSRVSWSKRLAEPVGLRLAVLPGSRPDEFAQLLPGFCLGH